MTLAIDIRHRLGDFVLDACFETGSGLVALFGRSGSGKTSIINVIAGLIHPDQGRITIDGACLLDTRRGIDEPRHRRRIGYVFQEGRLFPHLTVRQNLLYGRWFVPAMDRKADLGHVVDLLGISGLLERRPGRLSGGEKQRVAIGRALLADPRILLMDEPLASLDDARKAEILPYIERLRDESRVPIVYVSHSVAEVARLASTIVLLSEGKVAATGPAAQIMQRIDLSPLTGAEAGAIIEAVIEAHDELAGLTRLSSGAGQWRVQRLEAPPGSRVRIRVRASDVILAKCRPEGMSALNVFSATIVEIGDLAEPVVDVRLDCSGDALIARITRYSVERLALAPGVHVHALVKSVALDRENLGATGPARRP